MGLAEGRTLKNNRRRNQAMLVPPPVSRTGNVSVFMVRAKTAIGDVAA
ncbi:hypothetical protein [Azospirillum doebereinerae]